MLTWVCVTDHLRTELWSGLFRLADLVSATDSGQNLFQGAGRRAGDQTRSDSDDQRRMDCVCVCVIGRVLVSVSDKSFICQPSSEQQNESPYRPVVLSTASDKTSPQSPGFHWEVNKTETGLKNLSAPSPSKNSPTHPSAGSIGDLYLQLGWLEEMPCQDLWKRHASLAVQRQSCPSVISYRSAPSQLMNFQEWGFTALFCSSKVSIWDKNPQVLLPGLSAAQAGFTVGCIICLSII